MIDDTVPAPADVEGAVSAPTVAFESAYNPRAKCLANLVPFRKGNDPRRFDGAHRPPGAKTLISHKFVKDLMQWHEKHGYKAIEQVGRDQPVELLKLIASFVPKRVAVEHEHSGSITFKPVSVQEVARKTRELLSRVIDGESEDTGEE